MRMHRQGFGALALEGKADQQREFQSGAPSAECERAIVIPLAHADTVAARIEADKWHQHNIELRCLDWQACDGLEDPVLAANEARARREKAHQIAAIVGDPRQVDPASARTRTRHQRTGVDLLRHRQEQRDASAVGQPARTFHA